MSFFVLFRNNKSDKNFKNEMRFYKSLLKFKFTPIINRGNSYKIVDLHDNIITVDSTLGYECLVRNKKVFFFHDRIITEDKKNFKDTFGWPKPIHCNTGINLTKINKRQIYNFFNVNLRLDYNEWNSKYKLSFKDLMSFDYKNRALTELVKQCIKN
jgi:surface carbohydrate biosynthesis protein